MNTTLHLDTQTSLVQGPSAASFTQLNQPGEERMAGVAADLDSYRPFFRKLNLDVIQILTYDVPTVATQPLYQHGKEDPKLCLAELQFLLKDLVSKLEHRLMTATTHKPAGFPGRGTICNAATVKIVITNLIQLSLCKKGVGEETMMNATLHLDTQRSLV